jgi:2-phosphosulfolactate phosphatase
VKIERARGIEGARAAQGVVVVVDVIRAFTTAAVALAAGATEVRLFDEPDAARSARARFPGAFLMGEVGGDRPPGFDHGNSPATLPFGDVAGRVVLQRTGYGTRCVVATRRDAVVFASSLVVAAATARAVRATGAPLVTLVESGPEPEADDVVCDLLEALLLGRSFDVASLRARIELRGAAQELLASRPGAVPADLEVCLDLDRFDFAMRAERDGDDVVLRAIAG